MNVGWIIDAVAFDSYHDELAAAVKRHGHSVVSLQRPNPPYVWDDTGNSYRDAFPRGSCVVTHGDIDLVRRVVAEQIWTPGAFASVERFFCSHYGLTFLRILFRTHMGWWYAATLCVMIVGLYLDYGHHAHSKQKRDPPLPAENTDSREPR